MTDTSPPPSPPLSPRAAVGLALARGGIVAVLFGLFMWGMWELVKIEQAAQHAREGRLLDIIENLAGRSP